MVSRMQVDSEHHPASCRDDVNVAIGQVGRFPPESLTKQQNGLLGQRVPRGKARECSRGAPACIHHITAPFLRALTPLGGSGHQPAVRRQHVERTEVGFRILSWERLMSGGSIPADQPGNQRTADHSQACKKHNKKLALAGLPPGRQRTACPRRCPLAAARGQRLQQLAASGLPGSAPVPQCWYRRQCMHAECMDQIQPRWLPESMCALVESRDGTIWGALQRGPQVSSAGGTYKVSVQGH